MTKSINLEDIYCNLEQVQNLMEVLSNELDDLYKVKTNFDNKKEGAATILAWQASCREHIWNTLNYVSSNILKSSSDDLMEFIKAKPNDQLSINIDQKETFTPKKVKENEQPDDLATSSENVHLKAVNRLLKKALEELNLQTMSAENAEKCSWNEWAEIISNQENIGDVTKKLANLVADKAIKIVDWSEK